MCNYHFSSCETRQVTSHYNIQFYNTHTSTSYIHTHVHVHTRTHTYMHITGFSQDFVIGCPKWYFYPFCVIIVCPVPIFSIVNIEILGFQKSEYSVQKTGGWFSG